MSDSAFYIGVGVGIGIGIEYTDATGLYTDTGIDADAFWAINQPVTWAFRITKKDFLRC